MEEVSVTEVSQQANKRVNPSSVVGLGADFVRTFARRGLRAALAIQTMLQHRPPQSFSIILVLAVSMSACINSGVLKSDFDPTVPQIGYLKARVEALYQAEQARDMRTWYLLTSPEIRSESSYEEFLKESSSRTFELVSWRIRSISTEEDEELPKGAHAARVNMDVRIEEPGGPLERDTDQTDYWLYLDGEWYWAWRGWPND